MEKETKLKIVNGFEIDVAAGYFKNSIILKELFSDKKINFSDIAVFNFLCSSMNEFYISYKSQASIMKQFKLTEQTVRTSLQKLESLNLLKITQRYNDSNKYQISKHIFENPYRYEAISRSIFKVNMSYKLFSFYCLLTHYLVYPNFFDKFDIRQKEKDIIDILTPITLTNKTQIARELKIGRDTINNLLAEARTVEFLVDLPLIKPNSESLVSDCYRVHETGVSKSLTELDIVKGMIYLNSEVKRVEERVDSQEERLEDVNDRLKFLERKLDLLLSKS